MKKLFLSLLLALGLFGAVSKTYAVDPLYFQYLLCVQQGGTPADCNAAIWGDK